MNTDEALRALGVSETDFSSELRRQLDNDGFFIIENALSKDEAALMAAEFERLHALEIEGGGTEVHVEPGARRISNIYNKSEAFDKCLEIKPLLAAAKYLLGDIKLHGANLRDPDVGSGHQQIHADVPKMFSDDWWVLNAIIAFDDITVESGPPRVVPGSHKWQPINVPVVNLGDWTPGELTDEEAARVPEDLDAPYPGEVLATAPAGSAIIINSSLWHGGTRKIGNVPRRVLHLTYTRRDLPQQMTQLDYLTPQLYERMSPAQHFLMEIDPLEEGHEVLRQAGRKSKGWWN